MVHFQKDDKDATIRASELKPMFDRYLTEVIRNNNLQVEDYPILESYQDENYDNDYKHFDYQVRALVRKNNVLGTINKQDFFFWDRKRGESKFNRIYTYPKIIFKTKYLKLVELIQDNFEYFIAITFFGFRKGKGYGQFKLEKNSMPRLKLIKKAFDKVGRQYLCLELSMEGNEEVDYKKIDNFNAKLKTDILDIIETPDILHNFDYATSILKSNEISESNIKKIVGELKKNPVFINIYRETHLKSPKRKNIVNSIRYFRAILGVADKIADSTITCKGIDRFPNPVKYYVNYPYLQRGSNKIYLIIDLYAINQLTQKKNLIFEFSAENKSLQLANGNEFKYTLFWGILRYLLPKVNFKAKPRIN